MGSAGGGLLSPPSDGAMLIVVWAATFFVCRKVADSDEDEIKVHFYNGSGAELQTRTFRPVYIDPKDGKEIFTLNPRPSFEAFESFVKIETVVARDFSLTKQHKIPAKIFKSLPTLPPPSTVSPGADEFVDLRGPLGEGRQNEADDNEVLRIEQQESEMPQSSDYELMRQENLRANRAEFGRLFPQEDVGEARAKRRGGGHRGARGRQAGHTDLPVRASARLRGLGAAGVQNT